MQYIASNVSIFFCIAFIIIVIPNIASLFAISLFLSLEYRLMATFSAEKGKWNEWRKRGKFMLVDLFYTPHLALSLSS